MSILSHAGSLSKIHVKSLIVGLLGQLGRGSTAKMRETGHQVSLDNLQILDNLKNMYLVFKCFFNSDEI